MLYSSHTKNNYGEKKSYVNVAAKYFSIKGATEPPSLRLFGGNY